MKLGKKTSILFSIIFILLFAACGKAADDGKTGSGKEASGEAAVGSTEDGNVGHDGRGEDALPSGEMELILGYEEPALELICLGDAETGMYVAEGETFCVLNLGTSQPELELEILTTDGEAETLFADSGETETSETAADDGEDGEDEENAGEEDGENEDGENGDEEDGGDGEGEDGENGDEENPGDGEENENDGEPEEDDQSVNADDEETGEDEQETEPAEEQQTEEQPAEQQPEEVVPQIAQTNSRVIPAEISDVPSIYYHATSHAGTMVDFYYNTYESFSYDSKSQPLQKHAVIYLPYGYNENQQYEVFYYMHGGGNNEHAMLGTPSNPTEFKYFLDHAIEDGRIKPVIFVCLTYNNTSAHDSSNFQLSMQLCRNFHNELVNDVLPAVESTYSTYATGTSPEELRASRDHRGFGGFSNGSVCTWRVFEYSLDYFHWFLPISCGTTMDDGVIQAAASGRYPYSFFVYMMTGTADAAYSYDTNRANSLRNNPNFIENSAYDLGNFAYRAKPGYKHRDVSARVYTYNAFCFFYGS